MDTIPPCAARINHLIIGISRQLILCRYFVDVVREMPDPLLIVVDHVIMSHAHGGRLVKLAGLVAVINEFRDIPSVVLCERIKVDIFGHIG